MARREATTVVRTAVLQVVDVRCRAPRAGPDPHEMSRRPHVVLPRRGVFVVHRRGDRVIADVNTGLLLGRDEEYAVSHPCDGGDDCAVLAGDPVVFEQAFRGADGAVVPLHASDQLALRAMAVLGRCADGTEAEELGLVLLGRLGDRSAGERSPVAVGVRQRLVVDHARSVLAAAPTAHWDLADLAAAVHCSPFHLARLFRAATGETISRYLLRLRLAEALERLAGGEHDLGRLAADLGFCHHSHFTARFRRVFGVPPRVVRRTLTQPRLHELRKIVTAPGDGPFVP